MRRAGGSGTGVRTGLGQKAQPLKVSELNQVQSASLAQSVTGDTVFLTNLKSSRTGGLVEKTPMTQAVRILRKQNNKTFIVLYHAKPNPPYTV